MRDAFVAFYRRRDGIFRLVRQIVSLFLSRLGRWPFVGCAVTDKHTGTEEKYDVGCKQKGKKKKKGQQKKELATYHSRG